LQSPETESLPRRDSSQAIKATTPRTRRYTPSTTRPTEAWVREQTREYLQHAKAQKLPVKLFVHDRDTKFSKAVDRDLKLAGIKVQKTMFRAPNTNAFVERFIQTIQVELLDHFVVLGQRHFNYLVQVWLQHYHTERPHQSKDNEVLALNGRRIGKAGKRKVKSREPPALGDVRCQQRLGGLLKHYYRKAA
jgi:putative transposase